eukprot:TRINITY_DN39611_c0_g1_i1.p1 TRINITY_DN39611_c0_g1~~TRINITY_DN39611_c0_g1_i1.p1  ORF type:complete len:207 (-),score=24.97 TRINITY_DN39611_c0_g1_i1:80-700(-)
MASRSGSVAGRPRSQSTIGKSSQRSQLTRAASEASVPRTPVWPSGAPRRPNQLLWWSESGPTKLFPPSLQRHDIRPVDLGVAKPGPTFRDHEKELLHKMAWNGTGPFTAVSTCREGITEIDKQRAADMRGRATLSNWGDTTPIEGKLESSDYKGRFQFWSPEQMAAARSAPVFDPWHNHVEGFFDFKAPKKKPSWRDQIAVSRKTQ